MSCWDRFDRKVVLYFTGNKDTRVPGMERELARVGLDDADRQWQFPTPIDRVLLKGIRHIPCVERGGYFNMTMGHYRAISTAYHLGCDSVLVVEDDIRFLKDMSELEKIVSSIPDGYDVALLDMFSISMRSVNADTVKMLREKRRVNDFWAEFDELRSCGCYALSRRGMSRMMFCYEAVETKKRIGNMRICDHFLNREYLGKDTRMYFASKNAAVQRDMPGSHSQSDGILDNYLDMQIDMSEYAEA